MEDKGKGKEQGSTYAITFVPHSLQPEGGRRHVTLNCCVHRQDRMTSQHIGARIQTPMKKSYLLYVAACLKLLNLNFAVL